MYSIITQLISRGGHPGNRVRTQGLKCAEGHLTQDCNKSKDVPAKCVNCGEDHPTNATICQEYQKRLKSIELRNKNPTRQKHNEIYK